MAASCADCQNDPAQREYWGCEITEVENDIKWVDDLTRDTYYCCPINFIPQSVWDFMDEYQYVKSFPSTAIGYWQATQKWVDGVSYYETRLAEYQAINKPR